MRERCASLSGASGGCSLVYNVFLCKVVELGIYVSCSDSARLWLACLVWVGHSLCWRWRFEDSGCILLLPVWMGDREGVLLDLVVAFGLVEGVLCFLLMFLRVVS